MECSCFSMPSKVDVSNAPSKTYICASEDADTPETTARQSSNSQSRTRLQAIPNHAAQLGSHNYDPRHVSSTFTWQLRTAKNNIHRSMPPNSLSSTRHNLLQENAHEFPRHWQMFLVLDVPIHLIHCNFI